MPPKGSKPSAIKARARKQAHRSREMTGHLDRFDLEAASDQTTSRAGTNPEQHSILETIRINEPLSAFSAIKVTITLTYGLQSTPLPDIPDIETIMSKVFTEGQVRKLVSKKTIISKLLHDIYDMGFPADHHSTAMVYTDAAGFRHRVEFRTRWNTPFSVWAEEAEGGHPGAETLCQCKWCDGLHGPVIELQMDADKVRFVIGRRAFAPGKIIESLKDG